MARLDFTLTQKIRLFGSWLYQYARETGDSLPTADPIGSEAGYQLNTSIFSPLSHYSHGLGFAAPNATYNVGADIALLRRLSPPPASDISSRTITTSGGRPPGSDLAWGTVASV